MLIENNNRLTLPIRQIKAKAELLDSSATSASGTVVRVDDVAAGEMEIKLTTKNLIPYPYYDTTITFAGITFTDNGDGSINLSGTATGYAVFSLNKDGSFLKGGVTYCSATKYLTISYYDGSGGTKYWGANGTPLTWNDSFKLQNLYLQVYPNATVDLTIYPQLEVGTTATAYTPYITDFSGIEVSRYGKNLLNREGSGAYDDGEIYNISGLTLIRNADGSILINGTATAEVYPTVGTAILPQGIYYMCGYTSGFSGTGIYMYSTHTNSDGTQKMPQDTDGKGRKIEVVGNAQKVTVCFCVRSGTTINNMLVYPQVELGAAKTAYEPYKLPQVATADASGAVRGLQTAVPTTTVFTHSGAVINLTCNKCECKETFTEQDAIKSIKIDRVGEESKFFGFGVCQKLNIHLVDIYRQITTNTSNIFKIYFNSNGGTDYVNTTPLFYVTENHRDENTNELSITAYDILYKANSRTVAELNLISYTVREFAAACAELLGLTLDIQNVEDLSCFDTLYGSGANFEGTETLREALNAVAEVTQTIYFVTADKLVFKRLGGATALHITKEDYIELNSKDNRRLGVICHATELGDNVKAELAAAGSTQYVRDNPFWELREDIADLVDNALAAIGGLTINQFECKWRGNYLLEVGDKIELTTKDDNTATSFVINDTINYDGALSQQTSWSYTDNETETEANPSNLGESLKQTFARVDKANKQIDIVASEAAANSADISALQINTESINASVEKVEKESAEALEAVNENISTLTRKVEAQITADEVALEIKKELANGSSKVETSTGFTFNEEGLNVSKSGSEMSTQITEDGMKIKKNAEEVLTANNEGVKAIDLHATTYLIVGTNSRFENYGSNRTGCFWIGGNS